MLNCFSMKKVLYALLGFVIVIGIYFAYNILNPKSPLETVSTDDSNISITYSRPYKNDRLIFGEENDGALVPLVFTGEQVPTSILLLKLQKPLKLEMKL